MTNANQNTKHKKIKMQKTMNENRHLINTEIRAPKVIIIDQNGVNKGKILTSEALKAARALEIDLVMVSQDNEGTPIVKLIDYQKFKFDMAKKENHKHHAAPETKSIVFSTCISPHDEETKINQIRRIIKEGDNCEISVKAAKAWEPDARIRAGNDAFEMAKKLREKLAAEFKVGPVMKQPRDSRFLVNKAK